MTSLLINLFLMPLMLNGAPNEGEWSAWTASDCYPELEYRYKYLKPSYANKHIWEIQFRSDYPEPINFSWQAYPGDSKAAKGVYRLQLEQGESTPPESKYVAAEDDLFIKIDKVRIGHDAYGKDYVPCQSN